MTDPTKLASATIAITPPGPMLANGYFFKASGTSAGGATAVTGVLRVQNGQITGGELDIVFPDGSYDKPYTQSQLIPPHRTAVSH